MSIIDDPRCPMPVPETEVRCNGVLKFSSRSFSGCGTHTEHFKCSKCGTHLSRSWKWSTDILTRKWAYPEEPEDKIETIRHVVWKSEK